MFSSRKLCVLAAVTVAVFLAASAVQAGMLVDVRANLGSGTGAFNVTSQKSVEVGAGGIGGFTADAWMIVTGVDANAANDAFYSFVGGFTTGNVAGGVTRGNLAMDMFVPTGATGSFAGKLEDVDQDGDLDIGPAPVGGVLPLASAASTWATIKTTTGWNATSIPGNVVSEPVAGGFAFKLATLTYTATVPQAAADGASTELNFKSAARGGLSYGGVAKLDGATTNTNYDPLPGGAPVVLTAPIPEPSTFVLLGMGLIAALAFLRRR